MDEKMAREGIKSGLFPETVFKPCSSTGPDAFSENLTDLEDLISAISSAIIHTPDKYLEIKAVEWLKTLAKLLNLDRCIIHEYMDEQNKMRLFMNYTVPGVDAPPVRYDYRPSEGVINEFKKGMIVRAEKVPEDLPEFLRGGEIEKTGTRSIVIVPLSIGNQIMGNLGFINYSKEHKWPDELLKRVKVIGEIFAIVILKKQSGDALAEEMKLRRKVEERYATIVRTAGLGFWIVDLDLNILEVNDAYCNMSGYSRDELLNMTVEQIDISLDRNKVLRDRRTVLARGYSHHETRHIRKDGSVIDVAVSSTLLESEGIVFSFTRDISELNRARRELETRLKFEELVSEFSAALINVKLNDIKKEINHWLERFAKLLNVDRCTISEYQNDFSKVDLLFSYSNPDVSPEIKPLHTKPIYTFGLHKYLSKGEVVKFESPGDSFPEDIKHGMMDLVMAGTKSLLLVPLKTGDMLMGSMSIATLNRERKWSKELIRGLRLVAEIFANALIRDRSDYELDKYRKHLEKMVDERTAELKEAQRELVISEKMATLGRLTATVSHELRNPLGTIRSSVFSIQKRMENKDEKVSASLERVERNIKRCDLIIDELLDYSRAPALNPGTVSVDRWLSDLLDELPPPENITVVKELNSGTEVIMDRERFRRCIVNIMTNAYQSIQERETGWEGCVKVETFVDNDSTVIVISDNGVGFDMKEKGRLFEPLYSTKTYGVGLGVPITMQIIDLHGWKMDIRGEPQAGAWVTITIPAKREQDALNN